MDFITALPETQCGNTAIVAFVDRLTKMTHLAACSTNIGAEDFAKLFRHEVFRLHGLPYELISDRDPRFTSHFMTEVCRLLNIKQGMSTAYHPQTDGQTERTNRTLEKMLRHAVNPVHDDWDEHLPMVEFAINDAWQESTHDTPFMLSHGQHPLNPKSLQTHSCVPAAATYTQEMQQTLEQARDCLTRAQQKQKAYADKGRRDASYQVGDKLLLNTKNIRFRSPGAPKLMPRWVGPFPVVGRIGTLA